SDSCELFIQEKDCTIVDDPFPFDKTVDLKNSIVRFPLKRAAEHPLTVMTCQSEFPLAAFLTAENSDLFNSSGKRIEGSNISFELNIPKDEVIYCDIWSLDGRSVQVSCNSGHYQLPEYSEAELANGIKMKRISSTFPEIAAVKVNLDRPGMFKIVKKEGEIRWMDETSIANQSSESDMISTGSKSFIVVQDIADKDTEYVMFQAERVVCHADTKEAFPLQLSQRNITCCDLSRPGKNRFSVVASQSMTDRIGLMLSPVNSTLPSKKDIRSLTFSATSTLSVAYSGEQQMVSIWNTGSRVTDIKMVYKTYPFAEFVETGFGSVSGHLVDRNTMGYRFPSGKKSMQFALSKGAIAVIINGSNVENVLGSEFKAQTVTVQTDARQVVLLDWETSDAFYDIQVFPVNRDIDEYHFDTGSVFETYLPNAGTIHVMLPSHELTKPGFVRLGGAFKKAFLITDTGNITDGKMLIWNGDAGKLIIEHDAGYGIAWFDNNSVNDPGIWGMAKPDKFMTPTIPSSIELTHPVQVLSIKNDEPFILHLKTGKPVIAKIDRHYTQSAQYFEKGAAINEYIAHGRVDIWLRGPTGQSMSDIAVIEKCPLYSLTNGTAPEMIIAPGMSLFYALTLKEEVTIGLGIQSSSPNVTCQLLDDSGIVMEHGLLQMKHLEPGLYLIKVSLAESAEPAIVKPVVKGLEIPDTGPPENEIEKYIQLSEGEHE
ncbi:hypothetical protein JW979_07565, partial [bacterium]|nr:hypothetical protein [candidate division CSSED10-310 bacterium]